MKNCRGLFPETFRARKAIFSSSVSKNEEVDTPVTSFMPGGGGGKRTSVHIKNMWIKQLCSRFWRWFTLGPRRNSAKFLDFLELIAKIKRAPGQVFERLFTLALYWTCRASAVTSFFIDLPPFLVYFQELSLDYDMPWFSQWLSTVLYTTFKRKHQCRISWLTRSFFENFLQTRRNLKISTLRFSVDENILKKEPLILKL